MFYPPLPGGQAVGVGAYAFSSCGCYVPCVGLRFCCNRRTSGSSGIAQGPDRLKSVRLVAPSLLVLRRTLSNAAVQRIAGLLGDDVDHAARGAVAVAAAGPRGTSMRSIISGGTGRYRRASRAPRQPDAPSCAGGRFAVDQNQGVSGPMPRISIWRLLPRWPLVELPVRLTPHGADQFADVARRRAFLISSAVMVDTPGACRFCRAAVTTMVPAARLFIRGAAVSSVVGCRSAVRRWRTRSRPILPIRVAKE